MIFQKNVVRRLSLSALLLWSVVWGGISLPAQGETAWQLWRGNALLGAVAVREISDGTLVALDSLGSAAGYAGAPGEEVYVLEQGGRRVEFVAQAPVARVNGRIYPLSSPVRQEEGRWWADARAALVVLNGAEGKRGVRGLRWGGVAEEQALPASPEVSPEPEETIGAGTEAPGTSDLGASGGGKGGALTQVRRLRWGRQAEGIRVVFDLSGAPAVTLEEKSQRLSVAFDGVLPPQTEGTTSPFGGTVDLTVAQRGSRLVCNFSHRAQAVKSLVLTDPHRLVIDFLGAEAPEKTPFQETQLPAPREVPTPSSTGKTATEPPSEELRIPPSVGEEISVPESVGEELSSPEELPEPTPPPRREDVSPSQALPPPSEGGEETSSLEGRRPPLRRGKGLVVVDAGHGGKDPGAQGNKLREKDLNLKVAMNLAGRLKGMGFDVRLTRASDVYLKLKERTDIANTEDADLFISIHTNALPKGRHAQGVEIYLMALPTDKDAMELALFENRELAEDASTSHAAANKRTQLLLKILGDMQQNAKISDSMEFAETLFSSGKSQGLHMRRIAQAPFFVLRGAGMPAVLVEMGYITESSEAKALASQAFQDRMATALASGAAAFLKR